VSVASNLGGVGGTVGAAIITGIEAVNAPLFEAASFAGPFSPIILIVIIIGEGRRCCGCCSARCTSRPICSNSEG